MVRSLAAVRDNPISCAGRFASLNVSNQSWRGDDFEPAIRVLIDKLGDEAAFSGDTTGRDQSEF
jgi:hypothetical protein